MAKYIAKRVLLAIVTLFVLTSVVFVLVRLMPGDPFSSDKILGYRDKFACKVHLCSTTLLFPVTQIFRIQNVLEFFKCKIFELCLFIKCAYRLFVKPITFYIVTHSTYINV